MHASLPLLALTAPVVNIVYACAETTADASLCNLRLPPADRQHALACSLLEYVGILDVSEYELWAACHNSAEEVCGQLRNDSLARRPLRGPHCDHVHALFKLC